MPDSNEQSAGARTTSLGGLHAALSPRLRTAARYIVALRRRRRRRGDSTRLVIIASSIGVGVTAFFVIVLGTLMYFSAGYVDIEQVLVDRPAGITRVYDRTGSVELGVLNNPESPLTAPVELDAISPYLVLATVSTEDASFWEHSGVNVRGLLRAVGENLSGGIGSGSGGSSITQQLVKNVYICPSINVGEDPCVAERTVHRKLRELTYALLLEKDSSKQEILTWYLNQISYGDRYIGAQAASQGYFRKPASALTLAEAALLAGVPAAPTVYHPRLNCSRDAAGACGIDEFGRMVVSAAARERQRYVLDLMVERGAITAAEGEAAKAEPLYVYPAATVEAQRAPAFVDTQVEPRLVRLCEAGELPMLRGANDCATSVSSGGWVVVTSLDWERTHEAQQIVSESVAMGLAEGCECYNGAVVTIEPATGQLVVYVPNSDRTSTDPRVGGQIDQLVEINQPGSAFKPAVYLAWFDLLAKNPAHVLWDTSPLVLDPVEDVVAPGTEIVNPRADGGGEGLITARSALGGSQNVPAFRAAQEVGVDNVIAMAKRLGITTLHQGFDPTFLNHDVVRYGPTIATGGANIQALDMAYMMATIANMGVMVGLPHGAATISDVGALQSLAGEEGDEAEQQKRAFHRGHLRLPDTRPLDPVVILKVLDSTGQVIYQAPEPERIEVVNPGSVWLLHSILSDCNARWLIWGCGSSNDDYGLDLFVNGEQLPAGVKTGTQQGPNSRNDVLASWVIGYSRHAATAAWVGNANRELILDGPAAAFASGHTVLRIYKSWMARYHGWLLESGATAGLLSFADLQPPNVTHGRFPSPATERGLRGDCGQQMETWMRTDIDYDPDCRDGVVRLPNYKQEAAVELARKMGIPIPGFPALRAAPTVETTTPTPPTETPSPATPVDLETPTPVPEQPTPSPTEEESEQDDVNNGNERGHGGNRGDDEDDD